MQICVQIFTDVKKAVTIEPLDTITAVVDKVSDALGLPVHLFSLIFNGNRISSAPAWDPSFNAPRNQHGEVILSPALIVQRDDATAAEREARTVSNLKILEDSVLHLHLNFRGDIGVFVDGAFAKCAPGSALLTSVSPHPSPAEVVALAAAVLRGSGRLHSESFVVGSAVIIAPALRKTLISRVDTAWDAVWHAPTSATTPAPLPTPTLISVTAAGVLAGSSRDDFKIVLCAMKARAVLGSATLEEISAALAAVSSATRRASRRPPCARLRRLPSVGQGQGRAPRARGFIFHVDVAAATVQLPLGDAGACGGALLFALPDGRLLAPPRTPGVVLAHNGDVVHGVTRLERGTRYALYALVARDND